MGNNSKAASFLILLLLAMIWGSSFFLIKKGLIWFNPYQVGAVRVSIASLILFPYFFFILKHLKKKDLLNLFIVGAIGNMLPYYLFAFAEVKLDSSLAGVLNSLTPLFTLIIGIIFYSLTFRKVHFAGVLVGLAGAIGLILTSSEFGNAIEYKYSLFVVAATLCYAININIVKQKLSHVKPLHLTTFSFILVGPFNLIYLLVFTDFNNILISDSTSIEGLGYLAVLAIVGTAFAIILFNKLIQNTSAIFASSVTYLIPVFAILIGILDSEIFKAVYLLWIVMILGGVFMVNMKKPQNKSLSYKIFKSKD